MERSIQRITDNSLPSLSFVQEQEQLAALKEQIAKDAKDSAARTDKDFEGGYGGQEDLEDRYATTSGEH